MFNTSDFTVGDVVALPLGKVVGRGIYQLSLELQNDRKSHIHVYASDIDHIVEPAPHPIKVDDQVIDKSDGRRGVILLIDGDYCCLRKTRPSDGFTYLEAAPLTRLDRVT